MSEITTTTERAPRTGVLTFLLAVAIVLGAAGVLLGLFGVFQALQSEEAILEQVRNTNELTEMFLATGIDDETRRIQEEMTLELAEAQMALRPLTVPTWLINTVLSAGLLAGGILVLRRRDRWRRLLGAAAWAHLPYQVLYVIVTWKTAEVNFAATTKWLPLLTDSMSRGAPSPAGMAELTGTMMKASYYLGIGLAVAIALSLSAYYIWLAVYLRGAKTRDYCDN